MVVEKAYSLELSGRLIMNCFDMLKSCWSSHFPKSVRIILSLIFLRFGSDSRFIEVCHDCFIWEDGLYIMYMEYEEFLSTLMNRKNIIRRWGFADGICFHRSYCLPWRNLQWLWVMHSLGFSCRWSLMIDSGVLRVHWVTLGSRLCG